MPKPSMKEELRFLELNLSLIRRPIDKEFVQHLAKKRDAGDWDHIHAADLVKLDDLYQEYRHGIPRA